MPCQTNRNIESVFYQLRQQSSLTRVDGQPGPTQSRLHEESNERHELNRLKDGMSVSVMP